MVLGGDPERRSPWRCATDHKRGPRGDPERRSPWCCATDHERCPRWESRATKPLVLCNGSRAVPSVGSRATKPLVLCNGSRAVPSWGSRATKPLVSCNGSRAVPPWGSRATKRWGRLSARVAELPRAYRATRRYPASPRSGARRIAGVPSDEALGTTTGAPVASPSGISSDSAWSEATSLWTATEAGIPSDEAVAPSLHVQSGAPAGMAFSEAWSPTSAALMQAAAAGVVSEEALAGASMQAAASPPGISSDESLSPAYGSGQGSFSGVPSDEALGTLSIAGQAVVAGIGSNEALSPSILASAGVQVGIDSSEQWSAVSATGVATGTGIPSDEAFGALATTTTASLAGVPSDEAVAPPALAPAASLAGIPSDESLSASEASTLSLPVAGIPMEAFGAMQFALPATVAGIADDEMVGAEEGMAGAVFVLPGIAPDGPIGAVSISGGTARLAGIASDEALSALSRFGAGTASGIVSDEGVGQERGHYIPMPPPPPPAPTPQTSAPGDWRIHQDWEWRRHLQEMYEAQTKIQKYGESPWQGPTDENGQTDTWSGGPWWDQQQRQNYGRQDQDKPWQEYARRRRTPWNQPFPGQRRHVQGGPDENVAEPIGRADYIVMPTADGKEMLALADGVIHQLMRADMGRCALLVDDTGVRYLYGRLREMYGPTGRRVRQGDVIGLSGALSSPSEAQPTPVHDEPLQTTSVGPMEDTSSAPTSTLKSSEVTSVRRPYDATPPRDESAPVPSGSGRRSTGPALLLLLGAIPLMAVTPIPVLVSLAAMLLVAMSRREKQLGLPAHVGEKPAGADRPSVVFAFGEGVATGALSTPAHTWIAVTLPPPRPAPNVSILGGDTRPWRRPIRRKAFAVAQIGRRTRCGSAQGPER